MEENKVETDIEKALKKILTNIDIDVLTRIVKKGNSSALVYLPKRYEGRIVKIIILNGYGGNKNG